MAWIPFLNSPVGTGATGHEWITISSYYQLGDPVANPSRLNWREMPVNYGGYLDAPGVKLADMRIKIRHVHGSENGDVVIFEKEFEPGELSTRWNSPGKHIPSVRQSGTIYMWWEQPMIPAWITSKKTEIENKISLANKEMNRGVSGLQGADSYLTEAEGKLAEFRPDFRKYALFDDLEKLVTDARARYNEMKPAPPPTPPTPPTPPVPPTPPTGAVVIFGTVKNALGGNLIGAKVRAYDQTATVDIYGNYRLEVWATWTGEVIAEAKDYISETKRIDPTPGDHRLDFVLGGITPVTPPAPPMSDAKRRWLDFQKNPDIIKALGTLPDTTLNAFSRVFNNWDIFEEKEMPPELGHYLSAGLMLAGLTLAALAGVMTFVGGAAATTATTAATRLGSGARVATTTPHFDATIGAMVNYVKTTPTGLAGIWASFKALPLTTKILMAVMVTQLDVLFWAFGLSPEAVGQKIDKITGAIRGDLIRLDGLVKAENWSEANNTVIGIRNMLAEARGLTEGMTAGFWKTFGFTMDDKYVMFDDLKANLDGYIAQYPQITGIISYPEEITVKNVVVEDGDTLEFPNHADVENKIRFAGMDAHEGGTEAGIKETEYLKSLIQGKTITLKIDPYNVTGLYGRLLGVPFLNGQNVVHMMLRKFGKEILGTKYKNKYVDWDENKRVAAEAEEEIAKEKEEPLFYIDSVPSRAKVYIDGRYTHHLTPTDQIEQKDMISLWTLGAHTIELIKGGYSAKFEMNLVAGENPPITKDLTGIAPIPEEPTPIEPTPPAPPVTEFKISVTSTPTNAKIYIDDVYTHHWTPSDEKELKDVMHLLTPGTHKITVKKAGMMAEKSVSISAGDNGTIDFVLGTAPLPTVELTKGAILTMLGISEEELKEIMGV